MTVPWYTRARVAVVNKLATMFDVPITICHSDMYDYQIDEIDEYIMECEKLFGPVFDEADLPKFREWVHPFLKRPGHIDNPFNLYEHYLDTAAIFYGIHSFSAFSGIQNVEYEDMWKKYRASGLKLAWYEREPKELDEAL